jgi:hypothetical protein
MLPCFIFTGYSTEIYLIANYIISADEAIIVASFFSGFLQLHIVPAIVLVKSTSFITSSGQTV